MGVGGQRGVGHRGQRVGPADVGIVATGLAEQPVAGAHEGSFDEGTFVHR